MDDDIALIWLPDQSKTSEVAAYLNANANALFIEEVLAGQALTNRFRNPLADSRTPDIIVQPVYGTIYTASTKKNAEHGGFSVGDTEVGLIVSNPSLQSRQVKTPVALRRLRSLFSRLSDLRAVNWKPFTKKVPAFCRLFSMTATTTTKTTSKGRAPLTKKPCRRKAAIEAAFFSAAPETWTDGVSRTPSHLQKNALDTFQTGHIPATFRRAHDSRLLCL